MKTLYHGIDLVCISRLRRSLHDHPDFAQRVFTERERAYCNARPQTLHSFAARFAAKEATLKMLGLGLSAVGIHRDLLSIEVVCEGGVPTVVLSDRVASRARRLGILETSLSLSHEGDHAVASIVGLAGRGDG